MPTRRFIWSDHGATGAEKAMLVCVGLAIAGAGGHLVSGGSSQAGGDAQRTLAAGTAALGSAGGLGQVVSPGRMAQAVGTVQAPGAIQAAHALAFAAMVPKAGTPAAPAPEPGPPQAYHLTLGDTAGFKRSFTDKVYQHEVTLAGKAKNNVTDPAMKSDLAAFEKNWQQNHARYEAVAAQTGVPAPLIAAIHWRESGGNFNTYLHQGDPLGKPAVHVPRNIPVFYKWEDAAVNALQMKGSIQKDLGITSQTTDVAALAAYAEYYNGLGYYNKGRVSPYVFSGTDQYSKGKYVKDGVYDPNFRDRQLGILTMLEAITGPPQTAPAAPAPPGPAPAGAPAPGPALPATSGAPAVKPLP